MNKVCTYNLVKCKEPILSKVLTGRPQRVGIAGFGLNGSAVKNPMAEKMGILSVLQLIWYRFYSLN